MTEPPRFLTAGASAECVGRDPGPGPGEVSAPETDRADALAVVRAHDRRMVGAATDLRSRAALDILALQTVGEAGERAVERAEELHGCVPFGSVRHEPSGPGSQVPGRFSSFRYSVRGDGRSRLTTRLVASFTISACPATPPGVREDFRAVRGGEARAAWRGADGVGAGWQRPGLALVLRECQRRS